MRRDDFEALNERQRSRIAQGEKGEKTFVNPRNAAAGAVRQLDPASDVSAMRPAPPPIVPELAAVDTFVAPQ